MKIVKRTRWCLLALAIATLLPALALRAAPAYQMENLGRGVVAMRTGTSSVYVGWRLLGLDSSSIGFNVYRGSTKVNSSVLTTTTDLVDTGATLTVANTYTVRPVIGGVEQAASAGYTLPANAPTQQFLSVPLQIPQGGTVPGVVTTADPNPAPVAFTYNANDCTVADLDGDGEYEIIVKWDPSNSKDNSQAGYTGNVFLDAYKLNGTRLWRIDLGRNIRAGAHYTEFIAYDLDGDGKAEIACKTADGTKDGKGVVIGNASADFRNSSGYVLSGPEFMTIFNGQTGAAMATTNYIPARGNVGDWGDTYGNRLDRYNCSVAYLDGVKPSLIMFRGYYTRTAVVAWDWRGGQLTQRWHFDSRTTNLAAPDAGKENWEHMGNHQSAVIDVDGDGKDEIMFGALCINSNGTLRYTTGIGHGDAYHVGKLDPSRSGFQAFTPHEVPSLYGSNGTEMHDASTGALIWGVAGQTNQDVGRGCAFDIDPTHAGYECWGSNGGLYTCKGALISNTQPPSTNFGVWWDADPLRELLDGNHIDKWNWTTTNSTRLLTASECSSNNSTKSNPCLSGDIFGDWREEVIWRTSDNTALHIYTTTIPATNRLYTLMHDRTYREAIAWQNSAYNQPPHTGFYLGDGMSTPPVPNMYAAGANVAPTVSITSPAGGATFNAGANITITATAADSDGTVSKVDFYQGSTLLGTDTSSSYTFTWNGVAAGNYSLTAKATDNDGAVTTSSTINITVNAAGPVVVQSEAGTWDTGGVLETTNAGWTGTGYVNAGNAIGGFSEVTVNVPTTRSYTIDFRFANGTTTDRTADLRVNGTVVQSAVSFPGTGAWTTWNDVIVTKTLNAGNNTIRLTATTANGCANLDKVTVQ